MKGVLRVAMGDAFSKALLIGINLYLIRHLEIDQYAHFTLLLNAMFLGYQLACGPLERIYIAEYDKYRDHLPILQWVLSGVAALTCILWLWRDIAWTDVLLIIVGVFLLASYQVLRIRLQQRLDFTLFSLSDILKNGLWFTLLSLLFSVPFLPSGVSALLAMLGGAFISMSILRWITKSRFPARQVNLSFSGGGRIFWEVRYIILYTMAGALVPYLPIMMATMIGGDEVNATYGAAMRYQAILGMVVFAVNAVLLPHMAVYGRGHSDQGLLWKHLARSAPWALVLFAVAILCVWWTIPYIDGGKYPLLRQVFLILSIPPVLSLLGTPFVNMLLLDGRARALLGCMSAGLAVNFFGYILLRPSQGFFAPAWASLFAYATITVAVVLCECRKCLRPVR
ncbi:hypothetical protein CDEN61S_01026 [Castellaniella denitrificans]|uniref:lipopolysaccharide biosynthesis protein n=1 Tax=Castellaniella sp. TaxID=1955812 RepID=UPI003D115940